MDLFKNAHNTAANDKPPYYFDLNISNHRRFCQLICVLSLYASKLAKTAGPVVGQTLSIHKNSVRSCLPSGFL
jgi:hypothetical protein